MEGPTYREYEALSPFELKDKLISMAANRSRKSTATMLNAGRGNPNWTALTPREGFFQLGQFAVEECRRDLDLPDMGGMPQQPGIAQRFETFISHHSAEPGSRFLKDAVHFAIDKFGFNPDAFVHELADSVIGDNYPVPDRFLEHAERIAHEYLMLAMCNRQPPAGQFDLYATEGGTAAMCYVFDSLVENRILHRGDTIALGTPIFTPYIEIPHLNDYEFKVVNVMGDAQFHFSDQELAKLEDPAIKMFFLVNPDNPTSFALSKDTTDNLVRIVETKRPDLLFLTDDVYGTFVPGFRSIMADLPRNTIGVYSYSKYFGCTGWRLGVIAIHQDNVIDEMIARLPQKDREALHQRYTTLTLDPDRLKFIDRIVADSRNVALNHTAGLSLPQQTMMTLFSLFALMDSDNRYQKQCMKILHERFNSTLKGLGVEVTPGPGFAAYYGIIDLEHWLRKYVGDDVVQFIKANYDPLDVVFRLAADHSIVLLNGSGFDAPDWSVRVSFANLPDDTYEAIGRAVRAVARSYVEAYRFAKSNGSDGH